MKDTMFHSGEEFANKYLGVQLDELATEEEVDPEEDVTVADDNFDWRQHGAVGPVWNQGPCGSCWAFSAVGNIEGQWFLKSGELLHLSVQQVLDCDHVDHGCNGGYPPQVYRQVNQMGGLQLDADYSYKAAVGKCHTDRSKFRAYVNSSVILSQNEQFQANKLKTIGPLASTLNARTLQFYRKGIMHPTPSACNPGQLNHAVLTVGYGTEQGMPYWIVKNSWSRGFGEQVRAIWQHLRSRASIMGWSNLALKALQLQGDHLLENKSMKLFRSRYLMMRISICYLFTLELWCLCARTTTPEPENARQLYEEFKQKYKKTYVNDDDEYRFSVFKENLLRAHQLQTMEQGTAEYGVTQFFDLTSQEFQIQYLGFKYEDMQDTEEMSPSTRVVMDEDSFDWRDHGAVGPVLDQGKCGSCWAFSTIGNIEGQWFLKTGELLSLSEQQLIDCDNVDEGCNGGYPPKTYGAVIKMGGLELNSDYPYKALAEKCHMDRQKLKVYINDSVVFPRNEHLQAEALKLMGPLSSALNANPLKFYKTGIMHLPVASCFPRALNHAVLTVGYGTENGLPYWTVKNSWGTAFGEDGYFRIYRGGGTCGINRLVSTAAIR
ncbi:cathepsin F [Clonorchis sinensis]|uniref:Cathepsin F n=1 Tax=Clonorchis sinensis TaxID=79923 RepID=G7Y397_CLOSI|nr:cathepsin F [Clonorchis sinensis]